MKRIQRLAVGLGLCLLAAAVPAEAQSTLQAVIGGSAGFFPASGSVGPVESVRVFNASDGLAADAVAKFGQLGATASASLGEGGQIIAFALWQDSFTITGPTPGQLLDFSVTTNTHGSLVVPIATGYTYAGFNDNYARIATWLWGLPAGGACVLPGQLGGGIECNDSGFQMIRQTYVASTFLGTENTLEGDFSKTFSVQLVAGQTYTITQGLQALAAVHGVSGATTESNFLDTAVFFFTPVSPGAGYITASGHRYDAPATNTAPTATAGNNQTVRPGATVLLDGSGSFDDNTPTNQLQYAWSFVAVPTGSDVALTGANTMTPSFVPDLHGSYVVQLVVTDQGGLSSTPSQVTIGENPPPTASAGPDQLVILGSVVALTGSGADPDGDALTYAWTLTGAPTGSTAHLSSPTLADTAFIPDRPGVYTAQLTVSDPFGPGAPDSAQITATTAAGYAEIQIQAASAQVVGLPASAVTNRGNQNALTQFLSNAVVALQSGNLTAARHQLAQAISRTDGCAVRGTPDGNGPSRDWITTCGAQDQVYQSLVAALAAIAP